MFINLSNHPSKLWDENQLQAAAIFGQLVDLPFPNISPQANQQELEIETNRYLAKILTLKNANEHEPCVVHLMGELTFCFSLLVKLQQVGITCVASTTKRQTSTTQDGRKVSQFQFVQFREYLSLNSLNNNE